MARRTVTVPEAAAELGIGQALAWRLVWSGEIRSIKLGDRRLVPRAALDVLLETDAERERGP